MRPGDRVLVSGPIGDHGVTVLLARGDLELQGDVISDTAPVHGMIRALLDSTPGVHCMRDATRGGVATILNEIATSADVGIAVDEAAIPVRPVVLGACEILGIDPLYVACEGRIVVFVDGAHADDALAALRGHPLGREAAIVGTVKEDPPGLVILKTHFGGTLMADMLVGDALPRIC